MTSKQAFTPARSAPWAPHSVHIKTTLVLTGPHKTQKGEQSRHLTMKSRQLSTDLHCPRAFSRNGVNLRVDESCHSPGTGQKCNFDSSIQQKQDLHDVLFSRELSSRELLRGISCPALLRHCLVLVLGRLGNAQQPP